LAYRQQNRGLWRFGVDKKDFNVDQEFELRFSNREEATSSKICYNLVKESPKH